MNRPNPRSHLFSVLCKAIGDCRALRIRTLAAMLLLTGPVSQAGSYAVLRSFAGSVDGGLPFGSPTVNGSMIYGMTPYGGESPSGGSGVVFRMNVNGSGFAVTHTFTDGPNDGGNPYGSVTLANSTLYGFTAFGGSASRGSVFRMNTDGSGFSLLHSFSVTDGWDPEGSLTLVGSTLYGVASHGGGASDSGVVFRMNTDGTGFQVLHQFAGGANDGRHPWGSLTLAGNTLYGMTAHGGNSGTGVAFKLNTDGSGFGLLHHFNGGTTDASFPFGSLRFVGSALVGMSYRGGDSDNGVVFQMNTDGTQFTLLHEFSGGPNDGARPNGSITLAGSKLYGMTEEGGGGDLGVMFEMNPDGSAFKLIHQFGTQEGDGEAPYGDLVLSGETLYGMTPFGGTSGQGTLFLYQIPEPKLAPLLILGLLLSLCRFKSGAAFSPRREDHGVPTSQSVWSARLSRAFCPD